MTKILILGSNGALGSELAELYKSENPVKYDRAELDITDEEQVTVKISELKPELIINCAAYNEVDKADEERQLAESINGSAVGFIARAANSVGALTVHFSSNYVFDGRNTEGYNEDDLPNPQSTYAKSKLLGEMELQKNTDKFYLVRTAWLYGGKHKKAGKESFPEKMLKLAEQDESIYSIEDEFGNPTYVPDLALAVSQLIESKKAFGTYHLVNTGVATWYDWAKEIFSIKDIKAMLAPVPSSNFQRIAARPKYGALNNTKFPELRPWTEALKEYLQ